MIGCDVHAYIWKYVTSASVSLILKRATVIDCEMEISGRVKLNSLLIRRDLTVQEEHTYRAQLASFYTVHRVSCPMGLNT